MKWDEGGADSATILCDRFWPDAYGGLERKMWNLSRAMARCGLRVRVLTENRTGAATQETIAPNLTVRRVDRARYGPFWRCASIVRLFWWYRLVRSQVPAGSIWASDPRAALAVMLAGRGRDLVYQPIGCQAAMNRLSHAYRRVDTMRTSAAIRACDRLAYRHAPRVIFESRNALDQFQQHYGERNAVSVIHNGVEPVPGGVDRRGARQRWALEDHHWVVGFVGRLDPCKDIGFLLRAMSSQGVERDVRLLLVGQGPDREHLERMAAACGLTDRVVWAGRMADPADAFAAMDVLVLPSVYEVFGNVILEAMAAGVPVIGRRRDGDPSRPVWVANEELIQNGQTGLLVDPHDPEDLARQLMVLRLFPGARTALSRNARRWAAGRPWDAVVREYLRAMGRLSGRRVGQAA